MKKPREFHLPTAEWIRVSEGIWQQTIASDSDNGDYTRIYRLEPGAETRNGTLVHDYSEETYILEGDLIDRRLGATFSAGMYACRQPGMPHGPWRSEGGAIFLEFRYGKR